MQPISIHAPPRGATNGREHGLFIEMNFNSRPSARGDSFVVVLTIFNPISIHAPPRGATDIENRVKYTITFQFTPLREGRPFAVSVVFRDCISIHAPPRGATPILRLLQ